MQVSASNGVMVGDNNCMHIQNSHSGRCNLKLTNIKKKDQSFLLTNPIRVAYL